MPSSALIAVAALPRATLVASPLVLNVECMSVLTRSHASSSANSCIMVNFSELMTVENPPTLRSRNAVRKLPTAVSSQCPGAARLLERDGGLLAGAWCIAARRGGCCCGSALRRVS